MYQAIQRLKLSVILIFILFTGCNLSANAQCIPLPNAFAHNDYFHKHPLFDALDNGYTNIEADVFTRHGKLIVAHIDPFCRPHRTLEALYLKPLYDRITQNGGKVYKGYNAPVTLLIDIKSDANQTYSVLKPLLEKYKSILSGYDSGKVVYRAVTVVLSGHKPYDMIRQEDKRFAFIDEDLRKTDNDTTATGDVYAMASCKYSKFLKWDGKGRIPGGEEHRLCTYIADAHKYGKKVRLWASPENSLVWQELLKCGVDLINTDKLVMLKNFLANRNISYASSVIKPAGITARVN